MDTIVPEWDYMNNLVVLPLLKNFTPLVLQ